MVKVRRCDSRCHNARGTRCLCWCGGHFHGSAGMVNRKDLMNAVTEVDKTLLLQEHGFRPGQTVYLEQPRLSLEKAGTG